MAKRKVDWRTIFISLISMLAGLLGGNVDPTKLSSPFTEYSNSR